MTFSYKFIIAKAGDINTTEETLLSFLSQVFEWEGKKYIIKSEYIGKARNYLSKDEVDIKESEKEGLFSLFYENIAVGIQEGYLIENVSEEGSGENPNPEDTEDGKSEETSQDEKKDNVSSGTSPDKSKDSGSSDTSPDKIEDSGSGGTLPDKNKDNVSSEASPNTNNVISQDTIIENNGNTQESIESEDASTDKNINHNSDKDIDNLTSHDNEQQENSQTGEVKEENNPSKAIPTERETNMMQQTKYSTTRISEENKLVIFIVIIAVFILIIAYVKYRINE